MGKYVRACPDGWTNSDTTVRRPQVITVQPSLFPILFIIREFLPIYHSHTRKHRLKMYTDRMMFDNRQTRSTAARKHPAQNSNPIPIYEASSRVVGAFPDSTYDTWSGIRKTTHKAIVNVPGVRSKPIDTVSYHVWNVFHRAPIVRQNPNQKSLQSLAQTRQLYSDSTQAGGATASIKSQSIWNTFANIIKSQIKPQPT